MRRRLIAASVVTALVGFAGAGFSAQTSSTPTTVLTTPGGITFADVNGTDSRYLWRYFTTTAGKPLYTFDADGAGKPTCIEECAKEFVPYYAPSEVSMTGDWSLIPVDGKQKQYAYQGHPLYLFNGKDPSPNTFRYYADKGSAVVFDPQLMDPASKLFSPKQGWRRAAFAPEQIMPVPSGLQLKSMAAANGYVFLNKSTGMPLYTLKAAPKNPHAWMPTRAPDIATPVGDFSIIVREDGTRQWAYKGQGLFSYAEDYSADDLNGLLAQNDARLAMAYQNFMPSSVHIQYVPFHGLVMVNAQGLTLYAESHGRGMDGYNEAKNVGARGCIDECLQNWKPLPAGPHDVASGFWDIYQRPDGSRQWAYKGSALYTYIGDKRLGDMEGANREIIVYGDPEGKNYDEVTLAGGNRGPDFRPYAGAGFHWHTIAFSN